MEFTYTELNLRKYYRQSSTLRPSTITREQALKHVDSATLSAAEERAASYKAGVARINTMSDFEITVKAVQ